MRYLPSILLLVVTLASPGVRVLAQSTDDTLARSFFESGRAYFDRAEYDEAAHAFAEAYRLSHRPALLLNQARALEEADRTEEAVRILEQADREIPASERLMHDEVTQRLTRLRLELERAQRVAAERPAASGEAATTAAPEPAPSHPVNTTTIVGFASAGAGVAMLAVALGTGIAASHVQDRLDANCPGNVCPAAFGDDVTHGQRLARTSTAMTFLGVGAIGAAIPLVIRGLRHHEDEAPRVEVTGGPGTIGSGFAVRF